MHSILMIASERDGAKKAIKRKGEGERGRERQSKIERFWELVEPIMCF